MSSTLEDFTKGELVKLVTEDWIGRVTKGIIDAVEKSFRTDMVLRPVRSRDEIKRRFEICVRTFVELRRDAGWSVPRILDEMYPALRAKLDGDPWDPESAGKRGAWATDAPAMTLVDDGTE